MKSSKAWKQLTNVKTDKLPSIPLSLHFNIQKLTLFMLIWMNKSAYNDIQKFKSSNGIKTAEKLSKLYRPTASSNRTTVMKLNQNETLTIRQHTAILHCIRSTVIERERGEVFSPLLFRCVNNK